MYPFWLSSFGWERRASRQLHLVGNSSPSCRCLHGSPPQVASGRALTEPSSAFARAQTLSTVKPYSRSTTAAGAEAPKRSTPSMSPRVTDVTIPALRHAQFDREPRADRGRQHRIALGLRQGLEQLPARHRDAAHGDALLLAGVPPPPRSGRLRNRWRSGSARACRSAHRSAHRRRGAGHPPRRSGCDRAWARSCRVNTSSTGRSRVSSATRQATAVSLASPGRITIRFGIARRLASCSTG